MVRRALLVAVLAACAAPADAAQSLLHFQSPSGNIDCVLFAGGADCLVQKHSWPRLRLRPASCDVDWFPNEVGLSGTRVEVGSCRGDVGPLCFKGSGCRTLAYGRSLTLGKVRCSSARAGVTCRRLDGRRVGFRIAREGYTLFR
jgi:hypothetical protein